jgi:hypothetical protein
MSTKIGPVTLGMTIIVAGLIILAVSIGSLSYFGYLPHPIPPGQTTTQIISTTNVPATCLPTTQQPVKELISAYSSDSAITHPSWSRFVPNAQGQLTQVSDNPGQLTSGTASAASTNLYSIGPPSNTYELLSQAGETSAYPAWYQVNAGMATTPITQFGNNVFQVACTPSASNSAAYTWSMTGVEFQAPTTANSTASTSYAIAAIQFPVTPTAVPTTATTWTVNLNIGQAYRVGMLPYAECGTQASPVYNYATGQVYYGCPNGPGQGGLPTVQGYLLILTNQTSISVSAPGIQVIKSPAMASGTLAWAIPVSGSGPAPSNAAAANPYVAVSVPVQIQTSLSYVGGRHVAIVFWFIDMQQYAYLSNYLSTPAATSWTTVAGTEAGTSGATSATGAAPTTWFTGITPTTGQNAGNPNAFVNQYIGENLPY